MHDLSPYNLDRIISIHGAVKEISEAEQLISEKLRQYEVAQSSSFGESVQKVDLFNTSIHSGHDAHVCVVSYYSMLHCCLLDGYGIHVATVALSRTQPEPNADVSRPPQQHARGISFALHR